MAQFYTLDEAAARLGMAQDEFKRRLKTEWTSIRPFRDGATLRFRAADIDELARSLGAASDPGLQLAPPGASPADPDSSSDEFSFAPAGSASRGSGPVDDAPLALADDSSSEDLTVPADSGVRLSPPSKKKGDSDVKLERASLPIPDPEDALPTEELSLDLGGSGRLQGGGSGRLSPPKSGTNLGGGPKSGKLPGPSKGTTGSDSSSEFELSLDADSDSFELQMHTDSSDEVDLGAIGLAPEESRGGNSGINLGRPSDSGVSLEKKGPKTGPLPRPGAAADDSDDDLVLDLAAAPSGGSPSGRNLGAVSDDSDSEFELSLDDSAGSMDDLAGSLGQADPASGGDIFETDFELPAVGDDSASEVVAVDEQLLESDDAAGVELDATDMDVAVEEDSGSEVVLVDDEDAVAVDDADVFGETDLEQGASASKALRGVRRAEGDDDEDDGPVRTVVAAPAAWGPLPAAVLLPALVVMFLGGLMSFEALRGMWGYHQPSPPANSLVRGVAGMFGMTTTDAPK